MLASRRFGRPAADPAIGPLTGAERQRWYRKKRGRLRRRMAVLLLDLWERQPAEWRDEQGYRHREALALAHRLTAEPED